MEVFHSQFSAVVDKRMNCFKRYRKGILSELLVPILVITFGFGLSSIDFVADQPQLNFGLSMYPSQKMVFSVDSGSASQVDA